jgi:hypothetical protein
VARQGTGTGSGQQWAAQAQVGVGVGAAGPRPAPSPPCSLRAGAIGVYPHAPHAAPCGTMRHHAPHAPHAAPCAQMSPPSLPVISQLGRPIGPYWPINNWRYQPLHGLISPLQSITADLLALIDTLHILHQCFEQLLDLDQDQDQLRRRAGKKRRGHDERSLSQPITRALKRPSSLVECGGNHFLSSA